MELAKDLSAKYQEILTLEIQVVVDIFKGCCVHICSEAGPGRPPFAHTPTCCYEISGSAQDLGPGASG